MNGRPYKVEYIMQYTEVAYYDSDGVEVEREVLNDVTLWDESQPIELTDEEIEDYF